MAHVRVFDRIANSHELTDDEQALVTVVKRMVSERIARRAEEYDRSETFPWDNVSDINELGLNRAFIPFEHGGTPVSYGCYLTLVKEISAGCASTGVIWATTYHAIAPVLEFGTPTQLAHWLPIIGAGGLAAIAITEESGGSDATAMRTTFREVGDDLVIDGRKIFITNGDVANLTVVFGKWSSISDPRAAI